MRPLFYSISRKPTLRIAKFEGIAYIQITCLVLIRRIRRNHALIFIYKKYANTLTFQIMPSHFASPSMSVKLNKFRASTFLRVPRGPVSYKSSASKFESISSSYRVTSKDGFAMLEVAPCTSDIFTLTFLTSVLLKLKLGN